MTQPTDPLAEVLRKLLKENWGIQAGETISNTLAATARKQLADEVLAFRYTPRGQRTPLAALDWHDQIADIIEKGPNNGQW